MISIKSSQINLNQKIKGCTSPQSPRVILPAYCLLPNKARDTYQRTFQLLKEKAEELHLDLSPSLLLSCTSKLCQKGHSERLQD